MIQILNEEAFNKLSAYLENDKNSKKHTLDDIVDLATIKLPSFFTELYTVSYKDQATLEELNKSQNISQLFAEAVYKIDRLVTDFWKQKTRLSQRYYNDDKINFTRGNFDYMGSILERSSKKVELENVSLEPIYRAIQESNVSVAIIFQFVNTFALQIEAQGMGATRTILLGVHYKVDLISSLPKIFTNFSQRQLGLLTKVLSETKGDGYGFANLKKSQIDDLFSRVLYTDSGEVGDPKKLNKVTFGSTEDITKDIAILNRYFIALQTKLQKLSKKQ